MEWNDEKNRCKWTNPHNEKYVRYHDEEWGVPVYDDQKLFEMLLLECFQAGLSWECVLNKREAFRKAFECFDPKKVADYGDDKVNELCGNGEIIRNKLKIKAAVNNAKIFIEIQEEYGSFSDFIHGFTNGEVIFETGKASSDLSDKVSKELKRRGMKFVGTVVVYAYLQAIGVIYSHEAGCFLEYAAN